jgi:hypothetical protein
MKDIYTDIGERGIEIKPGIAAMLGSEIVRVDAVDAATGKLTIARGCLDTVPVAHPENTILWLYGIDEDLAYATPEYAAGTKVDVKLLTLTSNDSQLPVAQAHTDSVTLVGRAARPYPPGNFRINGQAWPDTVTGAISLTWAHRDRKLQAEVLVDTLAGSVGPEPGTSYTVRIEDEDGNLLTEAAGLTGNNWIWNGDSDAPVVRIILYSVRNGLSSFRRHEWAVTRV